MARFLEALSVELFVVDETAQDMNYQFGRFYDHESVATEEVLFRHIMWLAGSRVNSLCEDDDSVTIQPAPT